MDGRAQRKVRDAGVLAQPLESVDELECGADRTLRIVLLGDRGTPHRHDCVADELLDGAAVSGHHFSAEGEVASQQLAHILRITRL